MYKDKTAQLIHEQMVIADEKKVIGAATLVFNALQSFSVHNQILGMATAVAAIIKMYKLKLSDVFSIAETILNNPKDMASVARVRAIQQFMRDEWAIRFNGR